MSAHFRFDRRTFLRTLGGASVAAMATPVFKALADGGSSDDFYIFIHAAGGWDVTLSLDPRNQPVGIIQPASTENTKTAGITQWVDTPLGDGTYNTFNLIQPAGSNLVFGAAIGDLAAHYDKLTVVNGLAMNTVSHPDGTVFSATGRHLQGGRVPSSSIDTMIANSFGTGQLFPVISSLFPSSLVGSQFDPRAQPLLVDGVGTVGKVLNRSETFTSDVDRDNVTAMLTTEAQEIGSVSEYTSAYNAFGLQLGSLRQMLKGGLRSIFNEYSLQALHPEFNYKGRFQGANAVSAAFAIEAFKQNICRCVSFALGSLDTHNSNYQFHAENQQEIFNIIAALQTTLENTPHPNGVNKLADKTHILVISEFCRTPQINLGMGRDHYPNNSALVISPKFKPNFSFGSTDPQQLLPQVAKTFSDGDRAIAPPDLLATFLGAFGVDPRQYMRDGEIVPELLAS
ncbi:MAG: DUF1501 domain-containing protein [Polyangiales bacterium]